MATRALAHHVLGHLDIIPVSGAPPKHVVAGFGSSTLSLEGPPPASRNVQRDGVRGDRFADMMAARSAFPAAHRRLFDGPPHQHLQRWPERAGSGSPTNGPPGHRSRARGVSSNAQPSALSSPAIEWAIRISGAPCRRRLSKGREHSLPGASRLRRAPRLSRPAWRGRRGGVGVAWRGRRGGVGVAGSIWARSRLPILGRRGVAGWAFAVMPIRRAGVAVQGLVIRDVPRLVGDDALGQARRQRNLSSPRLVPLPVSPLSVGRRSPRSPRGCVGCRGRSADRRGPIPAGGAGDQADASMQHVHRRLARVLMLVETSARRRGRSRFVAGRARDRRRRCERCGHWWRTLASLSWCRASAVQRGLLHQVSLP